MNRFITVEGIEGAGKSTIIPFVREILEGTGRPVIVAREPGGTALGEDIRALLKSNVPTPNAEVMLMFAARAELLDCVIRPALKRGDWVLCDRFTDSTYAYQGGGRRLRIAKIAVLESLIQDGLRPGLTLLLDLPVEVGLDRVARRAAPDRFEQEEVDFHERVRAAYLEKAAINQDRIKVVNANRPLEAVTSEVEKIIGEYNV